MAKEKTCSKCHKTKPLTEFHFQATRGRHYARCKECQRKEVARSTEKKKQAGKSRRQLEDEWLEAQRAERLAYQEILSKKWG